MKAETKDGEQYLLGSLQLAKAFTKEEGHHVYIIKNGELVGWIDVADELRPEAKEVVEYFKRKGIKTILLSGDQFYKCNQLGLQLGMDEVIAEQSPQQKLERIWPSVRPFRPL